MSILLLLLVLVILVHQVKLNENKKLFARELAVYYKFILFQVTKVT